MKYDDWPVAKQDEFKKDLEGFLLRMAVKHGANMKSVDLDAPGAFAFRVEETEEETEEEKEIRLDRAETYIRAWFNIVRTNVRPPPESWSIYTQPIVVEFPSNDGEEMSRYNGRIVDVETKTFSRDPLIVIQNAALKPKKPDPKNPYFELIECHASQIVSFYSDPKYRFRVIRGDGTEAFVDPKMDENNFGPPEVS
jgi:hypothetical protein